MYSGEKDGNEKGVKNMQVCVRGRKVAFFGLPRISPHIHTQVHLTGITTSPYPPTGAPPGAFNRYHTLTLPHTYTHRGSTHVHLLSLLAASASGTWWVLVDQNTGPLH